MTEPALPSHCALSEALSQCPVIAILRGVSPDEAGSIAEALYDVGIRIVEVPLNSPNPLNSITQIRSRMEGRMIVGAGTVLSAADVHDVALAGGEICLAPNLDPAVVLQSIRLGVIPIPGIYSPTEAFKAVALGARHLKLFPAGEHSVHFMKSISAVLPRDVGVLAVGGVSKGNVSELLAAGFLGVGAGSSIFKPSFEAKEVSQNAQTLVEAINANPAECSEQRVTCLSSIQAEVGEGPLYRKFANDIIWTDAAQPKLYRYDLKSMCTTSVIASSKLSKVLLRSSSELVGIGERAIYQIDENLKIGSKIATPNELHNNSTLNDAVADVQGNIWIGSMDRALAAAKGQLFRLDQSNNCTQVADGFGVPNGLGFDDSTKTIYMVDTLYRTLIAMELSEENLLPMKSRIVSDFMNIPGKPDGLAIAPNGNIWVAMWGGSCLVEIEPSGRTIQIVNLPTPNPNAPVFVPDDQNTIYVTTSRMRLNSEQLRKSPSSGELLRVEL